MRPLSHSLLRLLLVAASGAAYALPFPPFDLPGVAWLVLAPLFWACATATPARAAGLGVVWTTVATLALGYWLPDTIARFFEVPAGLGWLALLGLAWVPAGLPIAACCAWLAWTARRGALGPLGIAAAFALTEFARSSGWPPLPYALLATAALPEGLVQALDALGGFGVGLLVAGAAALVATALTPSLRTRRAALEAGALVLLVFLAFAHGERQLARSFADGEALSVAIVQPGGVDKASDAVRGRGAVLLTESLRGRGTDLVVWPEHAVGSYLRENTPETEDVRAVSRELSGDLLLGAPHYRYAQPEARYFTSAFLMRGGELVGRHDKTRLVPFAEAAYEPGRRLRTLASAKAPVGALLCAEILFPGVPRGLARAGAELLANPSNDAWLPAPAAAHLLRIAQLRAVENRRPLLRATPTGFSAVIDAHGRVLIASRRGAVEVIEARVAPSRNETLTQRLGDWPVGLAALVVLATTRRKKHA